MSAFIRTSCSRDGLHEKNALRIDFSLFMATRE
jgi:hypothetical protein